MQQLAAMEEDDTARLVCRQLYDVARMSSRPLEADDLRNFLERSNRLIAMLLDRQPTA